MIRRTSDMMYPLEAPNGWFLYRAEHQHTAIMYREDHHEPLPHKDGPWLVQFQKYPKGGLLTEGRGHSLEEAWSKAIENCQKTDLRLIG